MLSIHPNPGQSGAMGKKRFLLQKIARFRYKTTTVSNRLKIYEESTLPLLKYYEMNGVVKNIDAMKSINEVTNQINGILSDL